MRSAAMVKSAVMSIMIGSRNSPAGTAKTRKPSGNTMALTNCVPSIAQAENISMNSSPNCATPKTLANSASIQATPASATKSSTHGAGFAGRAASTAR